MSRINDEIQTRINTCLGEAKVARDGRDWNRCWSLLEDAHVLSQPWAWPHTRVHAAMVVVGWKMRDIVEQLGQYRSPENWPRYFSEQVSEPTEPTDPTVLQKVAQTQRWRVAAR
jgi:hypothetical protein